MSWILLSLLAPLFWAASNIFDKYALEKVTRGVYDFLFFGSIGAFLAGIGAFAVFGLDEISRAALFPIAGGFLIQYSYLFYSHALQKEDASYVIPLYITYSVVVLVLARFFGEVISSPQLISFFIVFSGALVLSFKELSFDLLQMLRFRTGALLMIPAVLLLSVDILFVNHALKILSFTDVFIYDTLGFSLSVLPFFLVPSWRREILRGIQSASLWKYGIFFINDVVDLSGHLVYKFALLAAPAASLVAVLGGIQPFYVLALGILFTLFLPKIVKENITKKELSQKLIGATIIVIGIALLNLYS